jgi:hypothetical protein
MNTFAVSHFRYCISKAQEAEERKNDWRRTPQKRTSEILHSFAQGSLLPIKETRKMVHNADCKGTRAQLMLCCRQNAVIMASTKKRKLRWTPEVRAGEKRRDAVLGRYCLCRTLTFEALR